MEIKPPAQSPDSPPGAGEAAVTVDYTGIEPREGQVAGRFAWTPPPGAMDVLEAAGAEAGGAPAAPQLNRPPNTNGGTSF